MRSNIRTLVDNPVISFALASLGCVLFLFVRILVTGYNTYAFLIWNLFLAWIPFLIAKLMQRISVFGRRIIKLRIGLLFLFWLIFYPNAPYVFTDFIHIVLFWDPSHAGSTAVNALLWFDLILLSAFAFVSHLIGLSSIFLIHRILQRFLTKILAAFIIIISIMLSGFGIYLGRFIRLNTWDLAFNFAEVGRTIGLSFLDNKAMLFSFTIGIFILLSYLPVYSLMRISDADKHNTLNHG